jgi:hypothetical protein
VLLLSSCTQIADRLTQISTGQRTKKVSGEEPKTGRGGEEEMSRRRGMGRATAEKVRVDSKILLTTEEKQREERVWNWKRGRIAGAQVSGIGE